MSVRALLLCAALGLPLFPVWADPAPASVQADGLGAAKFPRFRGTLTVESALQVGLQQSLAVALGLTQVRQEQAAVAEAQSATRPQISLSGFANKNSIPMIYQSAPGIMPGFLETYPRPGAVSATAMFMLPLYTGGALENQLQAAEQSQKGAVARAAFTLRDSARRIRSTYYQVQLALQDQATLRWEMTQAREVERIAQQQLRDGKVAPYVHLRAQSEVANLEQKLNDAETEIDQRELDLKTAMGIAVDSQFEYDSIPKASLLPPAPLAQLFETALTERCDLVAARYSLEEGDRLVAAAVSEYAPKAYLVGMGESTQVGPFSGGYNNTGYSVGVVLSFSLLDGGLRAAHEQKARATVEERQLRLRQMELDATSQVAGARSRLIAALKNLDLSQTELDKGAEDWRIARLRLQAGRGIYLEILDALASLGRARNNRSRALYGALTAQADLLYATGRY